MIPENWSSSESEDTIKWGGRRKRKNRDRVSQQMWHDKDSFLRIFHVQVPFVLRTVSLYYLRPKNSSLEFIFIITT
jgi:hypothetical protein